MINELSSLQTVPVAGGVTAPPLPELPSLPEIGGGTAIPFLIGFPSNETWESFQGFRVAQRIGDGAVYDGKIVSVVPTAPAPLKWTIQENVFESVVSEISINPGWEQSLDILEGTVFVVVGDTTTEIPIDTSLWDSVISITRGPKVNGTVSFDFEVGLGQDASILGLKSVVTTTRIRDRWVRPVNYTWIPDSVDPFGSESTIASNVKNSKTFAEAGGWLYCGGAPKETYTGAWVDAALENDRIRQVSKNEGVWEYKALTVVEGMRNVWETCILEGYSFATFLDLIETVKAEKEEPRSENPIQTLKALSVLYEVPELGMIADAFDKALNLNSLLFYIQRVKELVRLKLDVTTELFAINNYISSFDYNFCFVINMCKNLSSDANPLWNRTLNRRPTGGRNLLEGLKADVARVAKDITMYAKSKKFSLPKKIIMPKLVELPEIICKDYVNGFLK